MWRFIKNSWKRKQAKAEPYLPAWYWDKSERSSNVTEIQSCCECSRRTAESKLKDISNEAAYNPELASAASRAFSNKEWRDYERVLAMMEKKNG